jgi:transposase
MDVLNKNDIKGHYIMMDNAPIHKPKVMRKLIEEGDCICMYLPLYLPFLNPIIEFWSKIKASARRTMLKADDQLTDCICELAGRINAKIMKTGLGIHYHSFNDV